MPRGREAFPAVKGTHTWPPPDVPRTSGGGLVSVPMTGVTPVGPIGGAPTPPPQTGPDFGVFVVTSAPSSRSAGREPALGVSLRRRDHHHERVKVGSGPGRRRRRAADRLHRSDPAHGDTHRPATIGAAHDRRPEEVLHVADLVTGAHREHAG